jgi:hypothetical protein
MAKRPSLLAYVFHSSRSRAGRVQERRPLFCALGDECVVIILAKMIALFFVEKSSQKRRVLPRLFVLS